MVGADFSSLEDRINALLTKDPNKLRVYTDGYDSHCLRSYYYFGNEMPDIEQAASHEKCFTANIGDDILYFKSSDTIKYENQTYTGEQFYELVSSKKL